MDDAEAEADEQQQEGEMEEKQEEELGPQAPWPAALPVDRFDGASLGHQAPLPAAVPEAVRVDEDNRDRRKIVRMLDIFLGCAYVGDVSADAALDLRTLQDFEGPDLKEELTRVCVLHDAMGIWADFVTETILEDEAHCIFNRSP